jgi:hypothetical protein
MMIRPLNYAANIIAITTPVKSVSQASERRLVWIWVVATFQGSDGHASDGHVLDAAGGDGFDTCARHVPDVDQTVFGCSVQQVALCDLHGKHSSSRNILAECAKHLTIGCPQDHRSVHGSTKESTFVDHLVCGTNGSELLAHNNAHRVVVVVVRT